MTSTPNNPEFDFRLNNLIEACAQRGVIMKKYSGYRDPVEQSALWRQSRPSWKVRAKVNQLRDAGAYFLADCIDKAGPSSGPHVTNAYGGMSWHNFAEAADCYWEVNGRAIWDVTDDPQNGYRVYGALAERYGLTSLGHEYGWDWVHVQLRPETSPHKLYDLLEINDRLEDFYEGLNNPLALHHSDGLLE